MRKLVFNKAIVHSLVLQELLSVSKANNRDYNPKLHNTLIKETQVAMLRGTSLVPHLLYKVEGKKSRDEMAG